MQEAREGLFEDGGREERKSNYCIIDAPHNSHSLSSKTRRSPIHPPRPWPLCLPLPPSLIGHAVAALFEVCHASLSEISRQ